MHPSPLNISLSRSILISLDIYKASLRRLTVYSRARLVVTSNVHAAVAAVAMGTPVIYLNDDMDSDTMLTEKDV